MKPKDPKKVEKAAKQIGFRYVRTEGSHKRYVHEDGRKISIPFHSGEDIGPGLMKWILRQIEKENDQEKFKKYLGTK